MKDGHSEAFFQAVGQITDEQNANLSKVLE